MIACDIAVFPAVLYFLGIEQHGAAPASMTLGFSVFERHSAPTRQCTLTGDAREWRTYPHKYVQARPFLKHLKVRWCEITGWFRATELLRPRTRPRRIDWVVLNPTARSRLRSASVDCEAGAHEHTGQRLRVVGGLLEKFPRWRPATTVPAQVREESAPKVARTLASRSHLTWTPPGQRWTWQPEGTMALAARLRVRARRRQAPPSGANPCASALRRVNAEPARAETRRAPPRLNAPSGGCKCGPRPFQNRKSRWRGGNPGGV